MIEDVMEEDLVDYLEEGGGGVDYLKSNLWLGMETLKCWQHLIHQKR
jgi:hypothetical protein